MIERKMDMSMAKDCIELWRNAGQLLKKKWTLLEEICETDLAADRLKRTGYCCIDVASYPV